MKHLYLLGLLLIISCTSNPRTIEVEIPNRIQLIEATTINGNGYRIIKVDDQEFITNSTGGIYPLTIKTNTQ